MNKIIFKGSNPPLFDSEKTYEVQELEPSRSKDQNAYLHGWVYPAIVDRFEKEGRKANEVQVHELMKYLFLRKRKKCPITGRYRTVEGSTTKLSRKAFTGYIESIEQWYYNNFNE